MPSSSSTRPSLLSPPGGEGSGLVPVSGDQSWSCGVGTSRTTGSIHWSGSVSNGCTVSLAADGRHADSPLRHRLTKVLDALLVAGFSGRVGQLPEHKKVTLVPCATPYLVTVFVRTTTELNGLPVVEVNWSGPVVGTGRNVFRGLEKASKGLNHILERALGLELLSCFARVRGTCSPSDRTEGDHG